jgi:FMN phosphatase YigB (HAD superfamily)
MKRKRWFQWLFRIGEKVTIMKRNFINEKDEISELIEGKDALLLDMNSTFMFDEDRFGKDVDYSKYYKAIGGELQPDVVNRLIQKVYEYLDDRYPVEKFRHCFPSLEVAIDDCFNQYLDKTEKDKIIETFSYHEHGSIPGEYVQSLNFLRQHFTLSLVADIWAPKMMWVNTFKELGIWELFSVHSFSSDHRMVKPSPKPFEMVVDKLGLPKSKCLVIGDSIRRDLGGAQAAALDCVLVGGAKSESAVCCYSTLLDFDQVARTLCS